MKAKKTASTSPKSGSILSESRSRVVVHSFTSAEQNREFDRLLEKHHYLGACPPVGDFLRQWVYVDGELVALLAWGSCCYHLKSRDEYIGWDPRRATERLKWVVQNRRYALLTAKGEAPNLASQVLGAVVRALPKQWEERFGYAPLAAESFSEIEAHEGTAYKASGWTHLGDTMGFARTRSEFFCRHGRPKKVWFKTFSANALERLRAPVGTSEPGADTNAHGVLPLKKKQRESLHDFFRKFPDPRARNRSYPLSAMLSLIVMAMLAGRRDVVNIERFGLSLTQAQRKELGMPRKKETNFRKVPGYRSLRNLLEKIDPDLLATHINHWLATQRDSLPSAMALDGKMVRDIGGVVSLVDARDGSPISMAPMRHKEEGPDGEATCARKALADVGDMQGSVVTADAGNTSIETATQILDQGGEILLQVKGNQPKLLKRAQNLTAAAPFLTSVWKRGMVG
jgi:hypothetical protein